MHNVCRKLQLRILEKFGSQKKFADALGVSANTVSRKLNQQVGFSRDDIMTWCELLDISHNEIPSYFFAL